MTTEEADVDPSIVTGNLFIDGIIASVLFDSGSTHSFVSPTFAMKLGQIPKKLSTKYSVSIPSGKVLESDTILKSCSVELKGRTMFADLVVLDIKSFEVILGMDWLSKNRATIDCRKKMVVFQLADGQRFKFSGVKTSSSIISVMKARKLINKGCKGYLVYVVDTTVEQSLKPEDVPVIRE